MTKLMKEGCWDLHQSAENGAFARRMVSGELGREEYVEFLGAMYAPMRELDDAIRRHRGAVPALGALVTDEQFQAPSIAADLSHFGVNPEAVPTSKAGASMIELIRRTEAASPLGLLGLHYVREGANNGNRYVAKKLRGPLGLGEGAGDRYLDPYGDQQRANWERFKTTLDAQAFTDEQREALVATGREMFRAVMGVHDEVSASEGAGAAG